MASCLQKRLFRETNKKNKYGEASVLMYNATGFRSVQVSGKVIVPYSYSDDKSLQKFTYKTGLNFLRLFPDMLEQKRDSSIIASSLNPVNAHRNRVLQYDFHYKVKRGGPDTETALKEILSKNKIINESISSYMLGDSQL